MVLAARLSIIAAAMLASGCATGQAVGARDADPPRVAGFTVSLLERDEVCVLRASSGGAATELPLVLRAPCRIVSDKHGKPISRVFERPTPVTVLIVFGTPVDKAKVPRSWGDRYCGSESQGILFGHEGVRVSPRVARGGLRCEGMAVDDKEFWLFAQP
jgi:hypothetical protein